MWINPQLSAYFLTFTKYKPQGKLKWKWWNELALFLVHYSVVVSLTDKPFADVLQNRFSRKFR